jgi:hypothetical protein
MADNRKRVTRAPRSAKVYVPVFGRKDKFQFDPVEFWLDEFNAAFDRLSSEAIQHLWPSTLVTDGEAARYAESAATLADAALAVAEKRWGVEGRDKTK